MQNNIKYGDKTIEIVRNSICCLSTAVSEVWILDEALTILELNNRGNSSRSLSLKKPTIRTDFFDQFQSEFQHAMELYTISYYKDDYIPTKKYENIARQIINNYNKLSITRKR